MAENATVDMEKTNGTKGKYLVGNANTIIDPDNDPELQSPSLVYVSTLLKMHS